MDVTETATAGEMPSERMFGMNSRIQSVANINKLIV